MESFLTGGVKPGVVLADSKVGWQEGYRGFEAEQRARDNVIQRIRAEVKT